MTNLTNEELLNRLQNSGGTALSAYQPIIADVRAELLRRLGAAVSASPQPRCPKCESFNVTLDYCYSAIALGVHSATCRICRTSADSTGTMFAQFFAAAPAQEPDSDLLARYNRAYSILGEALNLNPEFYGLVEMIQIVAKRLTGKYDSAAQEQPVENSLCRWCQEAIRPYGQQYEHTESRLIACRDSEHHVAEPSPQKGKP